MDTIRYVFTDGQNDESIPFSGLLEKTEGKYNAVIVTGSYGFWLRASFCVLLPDLKKILC